MGRVFKWIGLGFLAICLFGVMLGILIETTKTPAEREAENERFSEFQDVQRAKRAVQAAMRDPDSARFQKVERLSTGIVCGYVNGRNGFGGMTGMKAFMYGSQVGGLMMEGQGRTRFFRIWDVQCAEQSKKDIARRP